MQRFLGELTTEEVHEIIRQLEFGDHLARTVNPDYDGDLRHLVERLEHLLHRARRCQALADLQAGQCDGTVDGEECWLAMGHEGDHKRRREVDPES